MKIVKKVYTWIKLKIMNPRTIDEIIRDLNTIDGVGTWEAITGVQSLMTVNRQAPNTVNFALGSGVLIKGFLNRRTGEIKLFPAKMFGYPEQDI